MTKVMCDVEFPSVYYEYVLLTLVNKEAAADYSKAEIAWLEVIYRE